MSLQTKFALMLGVTALSVAMMLGVSLWSFRVLDREVSGALNSIESVLMHLNVLKRASWDQAELLGVSSFPSKSADEADRSPDARARYVELADEVRDQLDALAVLDSPYTQSGVTRARALREGARIARERGLAWFDIGDVEANRRAAEELYLQHERIERTERAIIGDAGSAVAHGDRIRGMVTTGLVGSASFVVLGVVLGALLVRRLILRPIEDLRQAAARIGAGDYEHRIGMAGADELAQLSAEVDEMAGLIKRMQDERIERERLAAVGEMIQRIVHNIRGPLGGIRSLADVAERGIERPTLVRDSLTRIRSTVDRFDGWVGELLRATRPADINPHPVRVEPWLAAFVESHRAEADSAGVRLDLGVDRVPEVARYDAYHLEHALTAVVTNAIQATPAGGTVRVRGEQGNLGDLWRIAVEDSGPGIDPDLLPRIFRPYFTTKSGGSGIGLAHARQIIERHGGRIWAENLAEAGSGGDSGAHGARIVMELPTGATIR